MTDSYVEIHTRNYREMTRKLPLAARSILMDLCAHYWWVGSLPVDDEELRRITRATEGEWRRYRRRISGFFTERWVPRGEGVWWQYPSGEGWEA